MAGIHFLSNVPLFANLSETDLEPLAQRLVMRKYRAGERVLSQGSTTYSLYIVQSGLVTIEVTGTDGETQTIARYGKGQAFGEFGLLDGLPRSAGAIASEASELLILSRGEFFMYLEQNSSVAINLLVLTSRRLRFAMQRLEGEPEPASPLAHLARLLVMFAGRYGEIQDEVLTLPLRLTAGELAGMMGQPRNDVSAALQTLQAQALIDLQGTQLAIHDLNGLRALAEA